MAPGKGFFRRNKWTLALTLVSLAIGALGVQLLLGAGAGSRFANLGEALEDVTRSIVIGRALFVLCCLTVAWPLLSKAVERYSPLLDEQIARNRFRILGWYVVIETTLNISRLG